MYAALAALCLAALPAAADGMYERAEAADRLAKQLAETLQRKDADGVTALFAPDGAVRYFSAEDSAEGLDAIREALQPLMINRANFPFETQPTRVRSGAREAWFQFDWTWGNLGGAMIARLEAQPNGEWRIRDMDLDGETRDDPPDGFDTRQFSRAVEDPMEVIVAAYRAIVNGGVDAILPLLAPEYEFIDANGVRYEGPLGLLAAAQAELPDSFEEDKFALYLSPDETRAVAYQDGEGVRLSALLLFIEEEKEWKVSGASISRPYDVLSVQPAGLSALFWAELRVP